MTNSTAFGFSAFGNAAFGHASSSQAISIPYSSPVNQVAIWYKVGYSSYFRVITDLDNDFGPENDRVGKVTHLANLITIQFYREVFVLAVYLFESDEDLSYLYRIPQWDVDSIYPQLGGAVREWNDGDDVFSVNRRHNDQPITSVDSKDRVEMTLGDIPVNKSPLILSQQGGDGISIHVSEGSLEK